MALKIQLHCANLQTERQPHEVMTCADFGGDATNAILSLKYLNIVFLENFSQSMVKTNESQFWFKKRLVCNHASYGVLGVLAITV